MDKEILFNEFLERVESCFELLGLPKHTKECEVEFDKQAARAALDRLFKDLRDFTNEIKIPPVVFPRKLKAPAAKRKTK